MYLLLSIPFQDANSSLTQSANGGAVSRVFLFHIRYVSIRELPILHSLRHLLFGEFGSNSNALGLRDVALDA